jgi:hypothetical protein
MKNFTPPPFYLAKETLIFSQNKAKPELKRQELNYKPKELHKPHGARASNSHTQTSKPNKALQRLTEQGANVANITHHTPTRNHIRYAFALHYV